MLIDGFNLTGIDSGFAVGGTTRMWRTDLKELLQTIRAHPQFSHAGLRFVADFVAWREQLGIINKVISNLARERILEHVMFLHYGSAADKSGAGATFERLASLSDATDEIGARAVRTALRMAQISGLIVQTRSRADARLRLYEPAEPLLTLTGAYSALALQSVDEMWPGLGLSLRVREESGLIPKMLARMGETYLRGAFRSHRPADPLNILLRLEGARPILARVVECNRLQVPLPTAQEFARLFYVSPSQTRVILRAAEARGLIRIAARGVILDAAPLQERFLDAQARYLAFAMRAGFGLRAASLAKFDQRLRSSPT